MRTWRRTFRRPLLAGLAAASLALGSQGGRVATDPVPTQGPAAAQGDEGTSQVAAWVEVLRRASAAPAAGGEPVSVREETGLVLRIVSAPRESWMGWVELLAASPPGSSDRRIAARLLGAGGRAADLERLARLAEGEDEDGLLSRGFASAFEDAVREILARESGAGAALRSTALRVPTAVGRSLATALAGLGGERALAELSALLGFDRALDPTLLAQIARVARPAPKPVDEAIVQQVRNCLAAEEPQGLAAVSDALGSLEDLESLDGLLLLLDHPGASVRGSAHRALKAIAGVSLPAERARWEPWIAEERAWFADRAPDVVAGLASRNRMTLVQSLGEIGMHRLHRRELCLEVAALLERPAADERSLACQSLSQLGSRACVPQLIHALEDEDPGVRGGAWAALRSITGADLPAETSAWAAFLEGASSSGESARPGPREGTSPVEREAPRGR